MGFILIPVTIGGISAGIRTVRATRWVKLSQAARAARCLVLALPAYDGYGAELSLTLLNRAREI